MSELMQAVSYLPGVGPKTQAGLADLGITTIYDLLYYFPKRYDDLIIKSVQTAQDQEKLVLEGLVASRPLLKRLGYKKSLLVVRLIVENEAIPVTFFNQPWLQDRFVEGQVALLYGRWSQTKRSLTGMKVLSQREQTGMTEVYQTKKRLSQKNLRKLITAAWQKYQQQIEDPVPVNIRTKYHLLTARQMIAGMHFPQDEAQAQAARRTAKFQELFLYQARLIQLRLSSDQQAPGLVENYSSDYVAQFIQSFPFQLTSAQSRVLKEILADLRRPQPMARLLQGDVGSGKTAVAASAIFASVTAGFQAALMVPTEILARQHYQKLLRLYQPFQMKVALLTGDLTPKEHRELVAQIEQGSVNIVVGTHALFQKGVTYRQLGLVVIDEQHRFGVKQRRALRQKGTVPDTLMMTATPIPRTLAITAYGELDLSTIDELPQGRQPVSTYWLRWSKLDQVEHFLRLQLAQKAQAFVIAPLVSESEQLDLANAEEIQQKLQKHFTQAQVGLVHGQMNSTAKEEVMAAFQAHELDILVATTVVEVGVDVPNATVMVICNAERFGLSQLHQLRGRIGRGQQTATCILLADPKNETALQRLKIMTETNDGFRLAQQDLQLRGAGDFFGQNQSGLPQFKVADPVADTAMLTTARQEARALFTVDPQLNRYPVLRAYLKMKAQTSLD
ncbi:ATP-dependent DNA helicase RecG [Lactobacillus sp. DCY120]|uniref:ATP-dependent DNA helicase RecG n=1 Tax=Bombilactobacillus apium TaxID=2675299 RepID=A0A850RE26_9LACO|nr:ATP-dependent DNA helicase RecG [Bombilactobacillus apium]NVY96978.1 ATP-dependent DNA helicase RecG [Bombilactobacillus apium]